MVATPVVLTSGRIAAELGIPLHRVLHVLRTRPSIRNPDDKQLRAVLRAHCQRNRDRPPAARSP